jgi:hypothetical protein
MNHECSNPTCQGFPSKIWIKKQIKRAGVAVIGVFPDDDGSPWFHYTIGNHGAGLPELLTIGGDTEQNARDISTVLTYLSAIAREKRAAFDDGEVINLGGRNSLKVANADGSKVRTYCTTGVGYFYKTNNYSVQQVLLSDYDGRYPGDPLCAEPFAFWHFQTICSERPALGAAHLLQ